MKICLNFVPNCFEEQEEPLQAWEAELHNSKNSFKIFGVPIIDI